MVHWRVERLNVCFEFAVYEAATNGRQQCSPKDLIEDKRNGIGSFLGSVDQELYLLRALPEPANYRRDRKLWGPARS